MTFLPGQPSLEYPHRRRRDVKRIIDVLAAGVLLVVLAPLLAVIALAIRVSMGSPVFFRQERAGLGGDPFTILKFRTMSVSPGGELDVTKDAERLTKLGSWLRRTSLDELPELLNILEGSMSLVGPRPLFMDYLSLYNREQARRHEVKPGLTGWAQVSGRNALTWDEKFELDVWYADNQSPWLDLRIVLRTILSVIRRDGISAEGTPTAHRFEGSA